MAEFNYISHQLPPPITLTISISQLQ
uniref:Uncharacterized protein n=1 Tax=Rhizophora mucronata TaxID=61149 RepID=A0A2P2PFR7_RHIMU